MSKIYEALTKAGQTPRSLSDEGSSTPPENTDGERLGAQSDELRPSSEPSSVRGRPVEDQPYILLNGQDDVPSKATDEFQVLAMRVHAFLKQSEKTVVLVSSAVSDEGKSFVVSNLGVALAKLGRTVILVDGDLRAPSLHRSFNASPLNGLVSYLLGKAELAQCTYATGVQGLSLIPAGGTTNSAPGLFSGPRMMDFIKMLHSSDPEAVILIDSAPILAASETRIVAGFVDAVLLVVAANQTSRNSVERSLSYLKDAPIIGMVLNRFEPSLSGRSEYGYHYSAEQGETSMF